MVAFLGHLKASIVDAWHIGRSVLIRLILLGLAIQGFLGLFHLVARKLSVHQVAGRASAYVAQNTLYLTSINGWRIRSVQRGLMRLLEPFLVKLNVIWACDQVLDFFDVKWIVSLFEFVQGVISFYVHGHGSSGQENIYYAIVFIFIFHGNLQLFRRSPVLRSHDLGC